MSKPLPRPATLGSDAAEYEEESVHGVYEAIAPHFARTRYKPWPLINRFLTSLPPGSLGLDSGAGNGKYIPSVIDAGEWAIALDRSQGLLSLARDQVPGSAECVRADLCDVPWRAGLFDFAISVAAIHHLSTPERRAEAVKALLRSLRTDIPARFFIYVWAYEQGPASKRKMGSLVDAAAGGGEKVQDVLVPWVVKPGPGEGKKRRGHEPHAKAENEEKVYHRYYHLFVEGELRKLVEEAAREDDFAVGAGRTGKWLEVVDEGWEADNWWIEGLVGYDS